METTQPKNKSELYGGIVWILSGLALAGYGILLFFNTNIPGMEDLIYFLTTIDRKYIYITTLIAVFLEGLYFIGSFFPGSSLVMILAILSQANGLPTLLITLLLIFVGWCMAGIINIYLAKMYRSKVIKLQENEKYQIKDHVWTTWFPAFRSSHEVAQIAAGGNVIKVFLSSLRVRFWATLLVGALALIVPLFFDIRNTTTEKEGFASIIIIILISVVVGVRKIRKYNANQT
ncbi:MAG: hypothetical protein RJB39_254 [Candidatus Parcubacteria bacterium]|jgi:hypothetical protein